VEERALELGIEDRRWVNPNLQINLWNHFLTY